MPGCLGASVAWVAGWLVVGRPCDFPAERKFLGWGGSRPCDFPAKRTFSGLAVAGPCDFPAKRRALGLCGWSAMRFPRRTRVVPQVRACQPRDRRSGDANPKRRRHPSGVESPVRRNPLTDRTPARSFPADVCRWAVRRGPSPESHCGVVAEMGVRTAHQQRGSTAYLCRDS